MIPITKGSLNPIPVFFEGVLLSQKTTVDIYFLYFRVFQLPDYIFKNTPKLQVGASSMLWARVYLVILAVIPALGVT